MKIDIKNIIIEYLNYYPEEKENLSHFYSLVSDFEIDEIAFVCESMSRYSRKKQHTDNANDSFDLLLSMIKPKEFLGTCVYLKKLTKYKINKKLMV